MNEQWRREWTAGRARAWANEATRTVAASWDPANKLRLSDADRDAVADRLGDHYAAGRLTNDELRTRLDAAWDARTRGEVPAIFADLPGGSPLRGQGPVTVPPWMVTAARSAYAARSRSYAAHPARASYRRRGNPVARVLLRLGLFVVFVALILTVAPMMLLIGALWFVLARGGGCGRHGRRGPASGRSPFGAKPQRGARLTC